MGGMAVPISFPCPPSPYPWPTCFQEPIQPVAICLPRHFQEVGSSNEMEGVLAFQLVTARPWGPINLSLRW